MLVMLEDRPALLDGFRVCVTCAQLYGEWRRETQGQNGSAGQVYVQVCACAKPEGTKGKKRRQWPGFDYNQYATLCYCCGLVPLPSGSKWSIWFCRDCKARVWDLNARFGRAVVPIGRHSLMNGVFIRGGRTEIDHKEIDSFSTNFTGLLGRMDLLREWANGIVLKNLAFVESSGEDCSLERYVSSVLWYADSNVDWSEVKKWVPLSKLEAFEGMRRFILKRVRGKRQSARPKKRNRDE